MIFLSLPPFPDGDENIECTTPKPHCLMMPTVGGHSIQMNDSVLSNAETPIAPTPPERPRKRTALSADLKDDKLLVSLHDCTPRDALTPTMSSQANGQWDNFNFPALDSSAATSLHQGQLGVPLAFQHLSQPSAYETPTKLRRAETNSPFFHQERFEYLDLLGKGSFSEVLLARHRQTDKLYAVKRSKNEFRGAGDRRQLLQEIRNLSDIPDCPFIVRYYRAWQTDCHLFIQTEYCPNGSLRKLLQTKPRGLEPNYCLMYFTHVLKGLEVLHGHNVLHLDLKPDNLLFGEDGILKIGDFGCACISQKWNGDEGDKVYLAPELLRDQQPTQASDIFSLGLILLEMCSGITPPREGDHWNRLRGGDLSYYEASCGKMTKYIATLMLNPDPVQRPMAHQLLKQIR